MDQLIEKMKVLLASNFAYYLKLHFFHWNVEGPNFPQYHKFLQKLYEEVFEAHDAIAEQIRTINGYAPGSLSRYKDLSRIHDQIDPPTAPEMISIALMDNYEMITILTETYHLAEDAGEVGLANFLQDRILAHKKIGWMLRATSKVL
jgi:starvation-inducible DNA-binding protein